MYVNVYAYLYVCVREVERKIKIVKLVVRWQLKLEALIYLCSFLAGQTSPWKALYVYHKCNYTYNNVVITSLFLIVLT